MHSFLFTLTPQKGGRNAVFNHIYGHKGEVIKIKHMVKELFNRPGRCSCELKGNLILITTDIIVPQAPFLVIVSCFLSPG